jgi:Cu(I)/Ag(I) efflux system membrane fusion protein
MHPTVVRSGLEPNGAVPNCPICGMPLSKRKKGTTPEMPPGVKARVQLTPERVRLAGIETVAASYMPLIKEVRAVGYVAYDERRLSEIVTRVAGYLEKLHVNSTFDTVLAGAPLAEIYSPALYSGVEELRLAQKHRATDLVASSRQRLRLLGISDREIDDVLADQNDRARLLIRSPQSGQVVEKNVVEGASVDAGATLFKVADLSQVWIEADVFERDLSMLRQGQPVEAHVEAFPGQVFSGTVALIYPELNSQTRTGRIRVAVENPELLLRPGMYASVLVKMPVSETEPFRSRLVVQAKHRDSSDEGIIARQKSCPVTGLNLGSMGPPVKVALDKQTIFVCCKSCEPQLRAKADAYLQRLAPAPEGSVLSIPEQSVIDTGTRKIVYVEREPGVFEGVEVELGPRMNGHYPVLSGLLPGDQIAAAGSFLLDAETRLNPAASSAYFGASGTSNANNGPSTGSATSESGHRH